MGLRFFTKLADVEDADLGLLLRRGLVGIDGCFDEISRGVVGARARRMAHEFMGSVHGIMDTIGVDRDDPVLTRVFPLFMSLGLRGGDISEQEIHAAARKSLDGAPATTVEGVYRPNGECRTYADVLKLTGWSAVDLSEIMEPAQFNGVVSTGSLSGGEQTRMVFDWEKLVAVFEGKGYPREKADEMARALVYCAKDCPGCVDDSGCDAISIFYPFADDSIPLPSPPSLV